MQTQYPQTNVVFVTGHEQYAAQAFALYPSGYMLKPATREKVERELLHLRYPLRRAAVSDHNIQVRCFGNFEVLRGGIPVRFRYSKTKELFAYLVDRRGARATAGELLGVLFEDKSGEESAKSYLRNCLTDLTRSLQSEEVLLRSRNGYAVRTDAFCCDYYEYLRQEKPQAHRYLGEYMMQYSWAETTTTALENAATRD